MKKTLLLIFLMFGIIGNLLCQENSHYKTFTDYADSIVELIKITGDIYPKELKQFKRWQILMESRIGEKNNPQPYYSAKKEYFSNVSSQKSASVNEIEWSFYGPNGIPGTPGNGTSYSTGKGWIYSIDINGSNPNEILAGSHHTGLWKTNNHGNSWTPLTDDYGEILGIVSMLRDGDDLIICSHVDGSYYAYSNGVYRSTNGGSSWNEINNGDLSTVYPSFGYSNLPRKLYRNPYDPNEIFFLTYNSLYKSTNNGTSWSRIFNHSEPWGPDSFGLFDIAIVRNIINMETIYISGSKIYKSTNGGASWSNITNSVTSSANLTNVNQVSRTEMATDPMYKDKVWFYFSYNNNCYLTKFDGFNYTFLKYRYAPHDNKNKLECEISPNSEEVVYVAGLEIQKYNEVTDSFTDCTNWTFPITDSQILGGTNWVHADIRDLKIYDNNGVDRIYAGHDGGVSWGEWDNSLSPPGYNFHQISDDGSNGLQVTQFYGFDVEDAPNNHIVGGCQDLSVFVYGAPNYSASWIHAASGDGAYCVIDNEDPNYVYDLDFYNNRLRKSTNGGVDFTSFPHTCITKSPLIFDPTDNNILFVGTKGGIRRYSSIRTSWTYSTLVPISIGTNYVSSVGIDPNNPNVIYAASSKINWNSPSNPNCINYMWKTINGGTSWTSISQNFKGNLATSPFDVSYITDIEINPNNSNEIWACFGIATNAKNKVFHSDDGGLTWDVLSVGYPSSIPANSVLYDVAARLLYVATDVGIFYYDNHYGWTTLGTGLPKKIITGMDINSVTGQIFVSTFGRGIWVAELPEENCYGTQNDIIISNNTSWSEDGFKCGAITIINNAKLTIEANIFQTPRYSITVQSGCELIIDGGSLESGPLTIESGGKFSTVNNGVLISNH